jgi:UDP-2,4-diacetamido-2,4,6-trideoxy-beta-L-altropyranose hydrolase
VETNGMIDKFIVRRASVEDAQRIWEIRNHPLSRKESLNTEEISLADHISWFSAKYLANSKDNCSVLEIDKKTVGYCRLDVQDSKYIVSIAIDPDHHGKGLGTFLLGESLHQLNLDKTVLATVRKDNPASLRIFEKNGFIPVKDDDAFVYLERS